MRKCYWCENCTEILVKALLRTLYDGIHVSISLRPPKKKKTKQKWIQKVKFIVAAHKIISHFVYYFDYYFIYCFISYIQRMVYKYLHLIYDTAMFLAVIVYTCI